MPAKVSVLIPTRHRIGRLLTLLQSYQETTRGCEAASELVFKVDNDDHGTEAFLRDRGYQTLVGLRHRGYDSMPVFFNDLAAVASGDVLMCGNDDMVFRSHGWALAILAAADKYPDGLYDFGVRTHNEEHYPFSVVSRRAVEALGFLWDPTIFWGDIYLRDVMAHFGRAIMLPDVLIEHDWAGHRPDQVFNESLKDITQRDPEYWSVTHRQAVDSAIARLGGLLE